MFGVGLALLLLGYFLYWELYGKRLRLPPGPTPFPVLGNLLQLDTVNPQKTMFAWREKYGSVFTIWIGMQPNIIVSDYEDLKKYFSGRIGDILAGRPKNFVFENFVGGRVGILLTDGDEWKEQRRFSLQVLRDFGFGRNIMEKGIIQQTNRLIHYLKKDMGGANEMVVDPGLEIENCVSSIIAKVVLGYGLERDDPRFLLLHRLLEENDALLGHPSVLLLQQGTDMGWFTELQMGKIAADLWAAGTLTTLTTIRWALLYLLRNPDVQGRVEREVEEYYAGSGRDRDVSMADRQHLPLTAAVIMETQRVANIVAINIPHCPTQDIHIDGYHYPKGTSFVPQVASVHLNPDVYPEPNKFNPDRFLESDGSLKKGDFLLPFSTGKRICLGESLARMELFIIFTTLVHHFHFLPDPEHRLPPAENQTPSLILTPPEHRLLIRKKH